MLRGVRAAMAHGELTPQVIAHQCHQRSAKEHLRPRLPGRVPIMRFWSIQWRYQTWRWYDMNLWNSNIFSDSEAWMLRKWNLKHTSTISYLKFKRTKLSSSLACPWILRSWPRTKSSFILSQKDWWMHEAGWNLWKNSLMDSLWKAG